MNRKHLILIIEVAAVTIGIWALGHVPLALIDGISRIASSSPQWLLMWVKGVLVIAGSLLVVVAFILILFVGISLATALRPDHRTKEEKARDDYYNR